MSTDQVDYLRGKYATFDENALPCPRLELRWFRQTDNDGNNWLVDYNLVYLLGPYDVRHTKRMEYSGRSAEKKVRLGRTKVQRGGTPISKDGLSIDTPFRDGAHIKWDAIQLRLPLYVVCDGLAQVLSPSPKPKTNHEPI